MLAGVSVDYYTRIERGNMNGASETVLDAIAAALQLDDAERAHLFDLVRAAGPLAATRRRAPKPIIRPSVQAVLDAMQTVPAYATNACLDVLVANSLGRELFAGMFDDPARAPNIARFVFLNPRARDLFPDWEHRIVSDTVGLLRSLVGRDLHNRCLVELVGELSTQSDAFRVAWAAHNVRFHHTGAKRFRHPVVGGMTLSFESFEPSADTDLRLVVYTAEAGSRSAEALSLLSSWTATEALERSGAQRGYPPSPAQPL